MKRLFAAIKIEPSVQFIQIYDSIRRSLGHESIKWVEMHNMHLTLKFFGETAEERIPDIRHALSRATEGITPFEISLANTGVFGSRYDPRVIWFGIQHNESLQQLAHNIFSELERTGWPRDRQNFVPHLTIGRIRELNDKALFRQIISTYAEMQIQQQKAGEIILYESILRREGPLYIKNSVFAFSGNSRNVNDNVPMRK